MDRRPGAGNSRPLLLRLPRVRWSVQGDVHVLSVCVSARVCMLFCARRAPGLLTRCDAAQTIYQNYQKVTLQVRARLKPQIVGAVARAGRLAVFSSNAAVHCCAAHALHTRGAPGRSSAAGWIPATLLEMVIPPGSKDLLKTVVACCRRSPLGRCRRAGCRGTRT